MIQITQLPTPDELAYNLNKLPPNKEDYQRSIKLLAESIIQYSEQIEQLGGFVDLETSCGGENGNELDR